MPAILAGAEEAAVQTWLVAHGDSVTVGQPLAEIETDKAVVELTAESAGTIGRLLVPEGDTVAVGDAIIALLAQGDDDAALAAALAAAGGTEPPSAGEPAGAEDAVPTAAVREPDGHSAVSGPVPAQPRETAASAGFPAVERTDGRRLFASPLVRRIAVEHQITLGEIPGTGPNGRIMRRDVERFLAERAAAPTRLPVEAAASTTRAEPVAAPKPFEPVAAPQPSEPSGEYVDVPLSRMRRAIARRLTESKSAVPHFYLVADCRVDELLALRRTVNENAPRKISVNDFVVKAAAGALMDVPDANVAWNGDSVRRFSGVDIAIAVAGNDGLSTPVVRQANRLSLGELSATAAELASRAREGRLKQHELEGGSLSVSNLGMYGTAQFSAILNPPQAAILAVGAARRAPVVTEDGELVVGDVMTVTLSADHRAIDGAIAAQWLAAFQRRIENPLTILV